MTEYDKLIKLLKLLDFSCENSGDIFEYRKIYNRYDYRFKFYKTINDVRIDIKFNHQNDSQHNAWCAYYYELKPVDICISFIEFKFKTLLRKQKINKLLNEPITKA